MTPTFLLIISLLGTSTPILIVPMGDARSCNLARDMLASYLKADGDARCYDLTKQNWDFDGRRN